MWLTVTFLLRTNAYVWVRRNANREPVDLIPLPPETTRLELLSSRGDYFIVTSFSGLQEPGNEIALLRSEVMHFRGLSLDGIEGVDAIAVGSGTVGTGMATSQYQQRFFSKGVHSDIAILHPDELGSDASNALREQILRYMTGWDNVHEPLVLEEDAKIQQLRQENRAAQVAELQAENIRHTSNIFNTAPNRVGDTSTTSFASLEEANRAHNEIAVEPLLCNFEEKFLTALVGRRRARDFSIKFDRDKLHVVTAKDAAEADSKMIERGVLTPDDCRAKRDLDPHPDGKGKKAYIMSSLVELGEKPDEPEPPTEEDPNQKTAEDGESVPEDGSSGDEGGGQGDDEERTITTEYLLEGLLEATLDGFGKRVGDQARRASKTGSGAFLEFCEGFTDNNREFLERRIPDPITAGSVLNEVGGILSKALESSESKLEQRVDELVDVVRTKILPRAAQRITEGLS